MENQTPEYRHETGASQTEGVTSEMGRSMTPPPFGLTASTLESDNVIVQRKEEKRESLSSPRFNGIPELEKVASGKGSLREGASGHGVQILQQCIYDLGINISTNGASGQWNAETTYGVEQFQKMNGLPATGILDQATMKAFDGRFGAVDLGGVDKYEDWTPKGVKAILRPWSPVTIETLRDEVDAVSFDRMYWMDEVWNGSSWELAPFEGAGQSTSKEIRFVNDTNEEVASTLYHEVVHQNQPPVLKTTQDKERNAYRMEEEFNIGMGLEGDPSLRKKGPGGRVQADEKKIDKMVSEDYPAVSKNKANSENEEIVGKGEMFGTVKVRVKGAPIFERKAHEGEKIPGDLVVENEKRWDRSAWE